MRESTSIHATSVMKSLFLLKFRNGTRKWTEMSDMKAMKQKGSRECDSTDFKHRFIKHPETAAHQLVEYMNCRFRGGDNTCICGFRTRDIYGFEGLNTYLCEVGSTAKVNKVGLQEGSGVHRGVSIFFWHREMKSPPRNFGNLCTRECIKVKPETVVSIVCSQWQ